LAYLGTLGSNAPFIGLLGTVVGIIMAFDALGSGTATAETSALLMASIAEALVATAIGLAVAIPAIVAFNYFQRRIKTITTNSEALGRVLIGWLKERQEAARVPVGHPMVRRLTLTPPVLCVGKEA
jgi:biopolymer transport protein ExbB